MRNVRSSRDGHVWSGLVALSLLAGSGLLPGLSRAAAADTETRDFTILVDAKKAGEYHCTITQRDDGLVSMAAQSDVRVTILGVPVYTYTYRGQEVWKGDRLQRLESSGKEKSRAFAITATVDGEVIRVTAEGKSHTVRPDVWSSSCWRLPAPSSRNGAIVLLGCDNGRATNGRIELVGSEKVTIAGQEQVCTHYRVVKDDVVHDVWYDRQERLAREEWLSGGHRTVFELTKIRR